ncbi:hypothetical protein AOQ84DRAFT_282905, partial [Glonium stellatum]
NRIGREWTSILRFASYIIIGFVIGRCHTSLTARSISAFIVLCDLLQATGHMGSEATSRPISAQGCPTAVRVGMGHRISAGLRKVGSATGSQAFTPLGDGAGPASTSSLASEIGVWGCTICY